MLPYIVFITLLAYLCFRLYQLISAKSEYSLFEKILYGPVYTFARLIWRVRVNHNKKIVDLPLRGAVLVANHRCSLDPFFIQLAAGRRVHWMVASEYFKHPLFGYVLRLFQAIPTTRSGADNQATKHAVRLASEGRLVGMFPEGRLNRTRQHLISMRPGAILVANKANVPIVPLWIRGAPIADEVWKPLIMPAAVLVMIGKPAEAETLPVDQGRSDQSIWLANDILSARSVAPASFS